MSYLMRVQIPDAPGSLGLLAAALGETDGDIRSVDVVQHSADGTVVDDIVVDLPHGSLPDTLITAAHALDDVEVEVGVQPVAAAGAGHGNRLFTPALLVEGAGDQPVGRAMRAAGHWRVPRRW